MKEPQALSILRKFTKQELKSFQGYLKGLYPKLQQEQQLLKYLISFYPTFNDKQLSKELLHQALYGEPYKGKKLSNLLSDLNLHAKEFLVWQAYKTSFFDRSFLLIQSLYQKELYDVAKYELNKLFKSIKRSKGTAIDYYQLFKFTHLHLAVKHQPNALTPNDLQQSYQQLNTFYLTHSCRLFCEILNKRNIYKEELIEDDQIIEQLLQSTLATAPSQLLYCYQQALTMLFRDCEVSFQQLRQVYLAHYVTFTIEDQYILLQYLINFSIPKIMTGKVSYEEYALDFYTIGFTSKMLLQNTHRSDTNLLNAVTLGCRLQKYEWVTATLDKHIIHINQDIRPHINKMAKAMVAFGQKDFPYVLELLKVVSFHNINNALRARGMVTVSLLEVGAYKTLRSYLVAFEKFLKKNPKRLSNQVAKRYERFVEIIQLFLEKDIDLPLISKKLNSSTAIYARKILLEKIMEGSR